MNTHSVAAVVALALLGTIPAHAAGEGCDRECLKDLADAYVAAMVAHDPKKAPLADDIRIVENVQRIKPGEGLWNTAAAAPTTFKIYVPDPVAQQVGLLAVMQEQQEGGVKPIELGLRLKHDDGKITEAEHVVIHSLSETSLKNLEQPRLPLVSSVPEAYRDSRGRLLAIGASYYDALDENNGSLAPFADDCVRFENGFQTARNTVPSGRAQGQGLGFGLIGALGCEAQLDTGVFQYIDRIENRRVWIADEETGLAFGLSHFRHPMTQKVFKIHGVPGQETRDMSSQRTFDMPAVHIYKIWGGQIHEIEAIGFVAPLNSPTGWE
jgi:hypothetical protein